LIYVSLQAKDPAAGRENLGQSAKRRVFFLPALGLKIYIMIKSRLSHNRANLTQEIRQSKEILGKLYPPEDSFIAEY
jgi:hypothetical protein